MIATRCEISDRELVTAVRAGDDSAFEELYRRYHDRIATYVRRMVRDEARAEDLAQDAFFSALKRMRATDAEIMFKPWIFEIARNAAIDHWRRSRRAEEVSVDEEERLRPADRVRLVGSAAPEAAMIDKERLTHLQGAFDELSDVHSRVLVMRELEGMSYREIADRLDLSRSSVESALFRARRRLESEYADISEGRRCESMRGVMGRLAEGLHSRRDEARLARHARRCHACRRRARELGLEPLPARGLREKIAALLPLPFFLRRGDGGFVSGLLGFGPAGAQVGPAVAERAAVLVAAVAFAGAGGAALSGADLGGGDPDRARPAPAQTPADVAPRPERGLDARTTAGSPGQGERIRPGAPARRRTAGSGRERRAARGAPAQPQVPGATTGDQAPDGGGQAPGDGAGGQAPRVGLPDVPTAPPTPPITDAPRLPAAPEVHEPTVPAVPLPAPHEVVPGVEAPVDLPGDTGAVIEPVTDALDQVLGG
jgi:RNA polymerase sigma factor (sigma-70 family)